MGFHFKPFTMTLPGTPQTIKGARYYVKDDGSRIIADQWDAMFKPAHGLAMTKKTKTNPDKTREWMQDRRSY